MRDRHMGISAANDILDPALYKFSPGTDPAAHPVAGSVATWTDATPALGNLVFGAPRPAISRPNPTLPSTKSPTLSPTWSRAPTLGILLRRPTHSTNSPQAPTRP